MPTSPVLASENGLSVAVLARHNAIPPDRHPALVYLSRLAPGSRRTMRGALDGLARVLCGGTASAISVPWSEIRYPHAQALRTVLAEKFAPATVNKHLAALRGVMTECWRLGLINPDDYRRAIDVGGIKADRAPVGRELSDAEVRALFASCSSDPSAAGARDAALLALLFGGGLRRSEAAKLAVGDIDLEAGAIQVREGKGRKDRCAYLPAGGRDAIRAWLALRGAEAGAVLCPVNKAGRVALRAMTDQAILYVLRRRAADACVAHFSPHDLRRTFISRLLDAGADINTVRHLAGHANVTTTARYDRRGERAKKRASELLHVPYVPQCGPAA